MSGCNDHRWWGQNDGVGAPRARFELAQLAGRWACHALVADLQELDREVS
jgi:hypothetical protein